MRQSYRHQLNDSESEVRSAEDAVLSICNDDERDDLQANKNLSLELVVLEDQHKLLDLKGSIDEGDLCLLFSHSPLLYHISLCFILFINVDILIVSLE